MADAVNVTLVEDDAPTRTWRLTSSGSTLNLTGSTVVAIIKASPTVEDGAASGVYTLTSGSGLTVVDPAQGTVRLTIPSAVMASVSTWYYKIRVTSGTVTETAVWGWIYVSDS